MVSCTMWKGQFLEEVFSFQVDDSGFEVPSAD